VVLLLESYAFVVLSEVEESVELSVVEVSSSSVVLVSSVVEVRYLLRGLLVVVVLVVVVLVEDDCLFLRRLRFSHSSLLRIPFRGLLVGDVVCLKVGQLLGHRLGMAFTASVVSPG